VPGGAEFSVSIVLVATFKKFHTSGKSPGTTKLVNINCIFEKLVVDIHAFVNNVWTQDFFF
jgi:hypothetical protein